VGKPRHKAAAAVLTLAFLTDLTCLGSPALVILLYFIACFSQSLGCVGLQSWVARVFFMTHTLLHTLLHTHIHTNKASSHPFPCCLVENYTFKARHLQPVPSLAILHLCACVPWLQEVFHHHPELQQWGAHITLQPLAPSHLDESKGLGQGQMLGVGETKA